MKLMAMMIWTMSHHRHHGPPCPSYLSCSVFGCTSSYLVLSAIAILAFGWLRYSATLSMHAYSGCTHSDRYRCIRASGRLRCFHSKVARTAIAIAAIGRLRLSAMAIAACMVILRATCCLEFFGPRTRNMFVITTGGWFLVVSWRMVQRSGQRL